MPDAVTSASNEQFLSGGGELARLIAAFDWASTALGPIGAWPQSLKTTVGLLLRSHVPIVTLWGEDGVMIYNDAYARFAGGRHPRLLGSKVRDGWPEVADFNDNVMRTGLAGGTLSYKDQELTLSRSGRPEQVWMDLDYSPILDESGQPSGIMAIVVETTDKVLAERWLRGEQDRLRLMFEQAPGFMAMLHGPDHVFTFANAAYLQLVGSRKVEGLPIRQALPEVAGQGFFELLDRVYASGEPASGLAQALTIRRGADAAPAVRYVDFVYQPLRDPSGEVIGIFVQGSDVTDRVAAEAQLRADEARHRQILDSATDYAIIATDLEGKVTRWNEGCHRTFGWSEDEMLGGSITRVFTPEDQAADRPGVEMREALERGSAPDERWHVRKSGERFWATGEVTPIRGEAASVIGFVKVLRDRTAEHRARQALDQSQAQLQRAQQAGGVGLFTLDFDDRIVHGTPEFFRLFGLSGREQVHVEQIKKLILPEDLSHAADAAGRSSGTMRPDATYRIRRAETGEIRAISRRSETEYRPDGRPARMVGVVQDITERQAVQRALEESEAQFRTLAQAMPNHVWTAAPTGLLDWFNEQVYSYSGLKLGELDGEGWTKIVHPDDLSGAAARWSNVLASGEAYETEFRLRRRDGAYLWHLARALPLRGRDGLITRWVGTNTDIHARKLADVENVRDRDRMWAMSQDLLLVCDFDGVITAVNPSAYRLLGWRQEEMVGRPLADFVHPTDWAALAAEFSQLSQGGATLGFESRMVEKSGGYRLLDWTAVSDEQRVHAVGRDITQARTIARDQERIWNLSPVLKVIGALDGKILKVNPAWTARLGWPADETEHRDLLDFVAPEDLDLVRANLHRLAAGEPLQDQEISLITKEDGRRRISWSFLPENGILYGFGRDITEQRLAEEALRQSQKMEAVGQLTGGIAHDFNNLIQGVTGSLDLVQKRISQGRLGELDRFIAGAMASAKRASALTHRLLAFSRRQPLNPRPVRANPLVASMEDLLRRTLGERIELELVLAGGLWLTRCDPNQLESAILNLAINARDAMPDGGKLVIETCNAHLDALYAARQREVRPGQYVCICVTDTGTGMSPQTVKRAFEPFFTTKPLGQGTGLGLSMIYGFAQQSEGYAKIYSELGAGTTFKLYLPRFRGKTEQDDLLTPLSDARSAEPGETVLVVEDEPVVRGLVVEVLSDLGYHAIEAADGPAGLDILYSRRRIDLLITDVGLPGLNGRQLADAGRERRPDLKVLFTTGYAENAALASGFLEPGMSMITKPFAMEVLATRIREMLESR